MTADRKAWVRARDELVSAVSELGYPEELGDQIARNLGSPKAMNRMTAYLHYVKPKSVELVVDEMLAVGSEIEAWREKKMGVEANAGYSEMLNYGLTDAEDE